MSSDKLLFSSRKICQRSAVVSNYCRLTYGSGGSSALGGFNDKEHRYFSVVPDRAENVFSGLIRVGLYELDEISTVKEFLVFEIFKVEI